MSAATVMVAGRYRLDDRLAVGGMGEVWRAQDTVLGRTVAVKLLRAEYASHAATLDRFRAEARHAGSLSHPGIAQVYDYGEAGSAHSPYLVMELVPGRSLTELLAAGPLDPARAMDLVAQVAAGLAAAHAAGLVHRDIKPGNLLLGPDGQVKITDFGIAHAAGSAPVTSVGTLVGTPGYLAPERVAGAPATPASDLYSLGIVAFECLAGAPPFSGTGVELAVAHRDRMLPALPPAVPAPVAALVTRLTAKDPALRPGSAAEVAQQAGRLHDAIVDGGFWPAAAAAPAAAPAAGTAPARAAAPAGAGSRPPDATLAYMQPATLPDMPQPLTGRQLEHRAWWRRGAVLAVAAAAAVLACLSGWLLAGAIAASPGAAGQHAARPSAAGKTRPAVSTVEVNTSTLVGQPVFTVRRQLTLLGLQVLVQWRPSDQQRPGTVVSVQPSGQVRVGSNITVTGASPARGHHDHGNGNGNGNDGQGGG